jgi:hypothetical protein
MICPNLSSVRLGTVAEQLVRYKLLRWGYDAIMTEQANNYDIFVDADIPVRIQVKSTRKPYGTSYKFKTAHTGGGPSLNNSIDYVKTNVDCFAFVALDIERIVFYPIVAAVTKRLLLNNMLEYDEYKGWEAMLDSIRKR